MIKRFRILPWRNLISTCKIPARRLLLSMHIPRALPRFNFVTTKSMEELEKEWEYIDNLKGKKCEGCGVPIQCDNKEQQGYIPREKVIKIMQHNNKVEEMPYMSSGDKMSLKAQKMLKDHIKSMSIKGNKQENVMLNIGDIDLLDSLEQSNMMTKRQLMDNFKNNKQKRLICMRCHNLKHESKLEESVQARVTSVEPERIFKDIFSQVRKGSTILHIVDLSDFSATISKDVIDAARKKGCRVILAVNKVDVMPSQLTQARIKYWIRMRISELGIKMMPDDIHLFSSKNGVGVKDFGDVLKKKAEKLKQSERDLYIVGHTNAGKSSFINSLIKESNRYEKDRYYDPFRNKQYGETKEMTNEEKEENKLKKIKLKASAQGEENEDLKDEGEGLQEGVEGRGEMEELIDELAETNQSQRIENSEERDEEFKLEEGVAEKENSEEVEDLESEEGEFKIRPEKEQRELTVSPYHGTTLELVKIEDLHLGWKVWDTPGIPNHKHISTYMESQKDTARLLHHKRVTPEKFTMTSESSLWIGALARLDYSAGDEINAVVYVPNTVSLHRTIVQKSNFLYLKQHGEILNPVFRKDVTKTVFNAYNIEVQCDNKGCGKVEVDIFGLGWIGFYSHYKRDAKTMFTLYLPQEVGFAVREALINFDNRATLPVKSRHLKQKHIRNDDKGDYEE